MGFPRTLFTRKGYAASVKRHSANGCPTLLSRKIYHFIERLPRRVLQDTPGAFRYFSLFRQFSAQKHLRVENPRGGVLSVFGVSQPHRAERDGIICFFLLMILGRNTLFFSSPVMLKACRMVSVSPEYSR